MRRARQVALLASMLCVPAALLSWLWLAGPCTTPEDRAPDAGADALDARSGAGAPVQPFPGRLPELELQHIGNARWRIEGLPGRGELELSGPTPEGILRTRRVVLGSLAGAALAWPDRSPR